MALQINALFGIMLLCACSGTEDPAADGAVTGDGPRPDAAAVPATVEVSSGKTTVKITTSPLSLSLSHDGKVLTSGKTLVYKWGHGKGSLMDFSASTTRPTGRRCPRARGS